MRHRRDRLLPVRDLVMHILEEGEGPLVLLCHGFPEGAVSWRRQISDLAEGGFRAVAPDLRGYGKTVGPATPELCDIVSLTADLVALVEALGETHCLLVGHDFGALLSWHAASLRPDVFRAVACLSVGFPSFLVGSRPPLEVLEAKFSETFHYICWFQEPGRAEAELEADPRGTLAKIFYASSGEAPEAARMTFLPGPPGRTTLLGDTPAPPHLPSWLTEADLDLYASGFAERGFGGALAWYRAMDRSWERLGRGLDPAAARVEVPALYVVGDRDEVFRSTSGLLSRMKEAVPRLEGIVTLEGCGHWTQQERPAEVSRALLDFLGRHV